MKDKKPLKERAKEYFKSLGIDIDEKPNENLETITVPCTIEIESVVFYSYVEIVFEYNGCTYKYTGNAGGIGVGDLTAEGVIYFGDLNKLIGTKAFGVTFAAEDGGVVQVTWGTHGNATAAGIGEGLGAFGGSGSWKKYGC
ncbi:MAG: hypothetical protein ACXADW_15155 [Candidatus Hodarchaeales archaeon]|jgi:hypothetical protein